MSLLDAGSVVGYLAGRGLADPATASGQVLAGGVSNVVLAVTDAGRRLVVKQSLPRLRVADEWTAPVERVLTEADAMQAAATIAPGAVPAVLDRDPARHTIVLEAAPPQWRDWKVRLLAGEIDPGVGVRLGEFLAAWHGGTRDADWLPASLRGGAEAFEALRVDPFHRTVARRAPELAGPVLEVVEQMLSRRVCLVHGDFSPKNVLVGPDGGEWVIDFEVTHVGDPAFDLAFLLAHLTLKAVHRPELAAGYDRCTAAFTEAYTRDAGAVPDWPYVLRHTGCLLLARVRGKSPAEYLTEPERERAWRLGTDLLHDPPERPDRIGARREALPG